VTSAHLRVRTPACTPVHSLLTPGHVSYVPLPNDLLRLARFPASATAAAAAAVVVVVDVVEPPATDDAGALSGRADACSPDIDSHRSRDDVTSHGGFRSVSDALSRCGESTDAAGPDCS